MQDLIQDNQLKYLIELCKAKNIPDEEILKILEENSKSEFLKIVCDSWKNSKDFALVPSKWQEYSMKYIEYMGSIMDPTKRYSTLPLEPNWPNPQVKKKTEIKFKRDLILFVLKEKNKILKTILKESSDFSEMFNVNSSDVTAVNNSPMAELPKAIQSPVKSPKKSHVVKEKKTLQKDLESWSFDNSDDEFSSKGPILVVLKESNDLKKDSKKKERGQELASSSKRHKPDLELTVDRKEDDVSSAAKQDSAQVKPNSAQVKKDSVQVEQDSAQVKEDVAQVLQDSAQVKEDAAQVLQDITEKKDFDGNDLQSLREKVFMSRKTSKKDLVANDMNSGSEISKTETSLEVLENGKPDIGLEEGEISSDGSPEDFNNGTNTKNIEDKEQKNYNNYGKRASGAESRVRRYDSRYKKDDRRDKIVYPTSGAVQKHRADVPANVAMSSYMAYPAGGNMHQSNNYMGSMPFFRPPIYSMGFNQQFQQPNPYMQIDSNALAKAQMLANISQQQSQQPMFPPQMSGTRTGPGLNRPPMQYTNSNQTNFWMMNMPHMNNGPGFAFAPGNIPPNGPFYSSLGPRPGESPQVDSGYIFEDPASRS